MELFFFYPEEKLQIRVFDFLPWRASDLKIYNKKRFVITIGIRDLKSLEEISTVLCHELAHLFIYKRFPSHLEKPYSFHKEIIHEFLTWIVTIFLLQEIKIPFQNWIFETTFLKEFDEFLISFDNLGKIKRFLNNPTYDKS